VRKLYSNGAPELNRVLRLCHPSPLCHPELPSVIPSVVEGSLYMPMHEVAPSAVSTAVITDAIICSVHFSVSFLLIIHLLPDEWPQRTS